MQMRRNRTRERRGTGSASGQSPPYGEQKRHIYHSSRECLSMSNVRKGEDFRSTENGERSMESVQWRAFFAKSGADYTGRPPYRTDDVAKKRIERNRTTAGELGCLFVVRGPQDSPRVPPAGRSPTIGGLGERRTGTGAPQTDSPGGRNERHWSTADTPLPVPQ